MSRLLASLRSAINACIDVTSSLYCKQIVSASLTLLASVGRHVLKWCLRQLPSSNLESSVFYFEGSLLLPTSQTFSNISNGSRVQLLCQVQLCGCVCVGGGGGGA